MIIFGFFRSCSGQKTPVYRQDTHEKQIAFDKQIPDILGSKIVPIEIIKRNRNQVSTEVIYEITDFALAYGIGYDGLAALGFIAINNKNNKYFCRGLEKIQFNFLENEKIAFRWSYPDDSCNI